MINIIFNRIKKMLNCKCKIKDWSNDRFDFTDHTLLCYRGFKTEYKDSNLSLKTGNTIQEFIFVNIVDIIDVKTISGLIKIKR